MDNKRKAAASNEAGPTEGKDRAMKRQKQHQPPQEFDLLKGESPESTTAYGLVFLEQIRKTADKNGRTVADHFEELPPRKKNEDYYKAIRLPISLAIIEQKLNNHEFSTLSELEAYFKRMVLNAKEYYSRGSQVFEDSERIRKALSNYMTKTNPAYKLVNGYSCMPTPIPDESEDQAGEANEETPKGEGDEDVENGDKHDDGSDDDHDSDDGLGGRRTSRRSKRNSVPKVPEKAAGSKAKPDHEYEDVPYKGLTFQQAQEKIVEELIRKEDDDEPGWMKFEAFLNLPPRSLKDYFALIHDPISLKALQKLVRGIHGRQPATGVSDFKGWAAFEEKASLLWKNAHFYNEEGSSIYNLATELKDFLEDQLGQAKAAVPEPPQPPKIKLKVPSAQESPAPPNPTKKITIHVGGSRGSTVASPAPQAGPSRKSDTPEMSSNAGPAQEQNLPGAPNGGQPAAVNASQAEGATPVSAVAAAASASPASAPVKQEPLNRQSPAMGPGSNAQTPNNNGVPEHAQAANGGQQALAAQNDAQGIAPNPPQVVKEVWDHDHRSPGKGIDDALIKVLNIQTHPTCLGLENPILYEITADAVMARRNLIISIPSNQLKLEAHLTIPAFPDLVRQFKLFFQLNGVTLYPKPPHRLTSDPLHPGVTTLSFDLSLIPGMNWIHVNLIAALPGLQPLPTGELCELETLTVIAQVLR